MSTATQMDTAEEGWKNVSYGPQKRTKKDVQMDMILEPVELEKMEVEDSDDEAPEGDMPYEKPQFGECKVTSVKRKRELRRIPVPSHRLTPLRNSWKELLSPLVEHLKLQVRMNTKRRCVEVRLGEDADDAGALQKGADFMKAFMMGFEVPDAIAMLRLNDIFIEAFQVKDVKRHNGDHMSRCIGRMAGKDGKTKYAIENATRTRIVIQNDKVHILGSFANIKQARDSICSLILGSDAGKVYNRLKTVSRRISERL